MSDTTDTPSTGFPMGDDPLQVVDLIEEALHLQRHSSSAMMEEAHNLEALAESYSQYITAYTDRFITAWETAMKAYQADVGQWEAAVAELKAHNISDATSGTASDAAKPPRKPKPPKT